MPDTLLTLDDLLEFLDACPERLTRPMNQAEVDRRVVEADVAGDGVEGRVRSARGRRAEKVRIDRSNEAVISRCTCRPGSRRPCDHAVALAYSGVGLLRRVEQKSLFGRAGSPERSGGTASSPRPRREGRGAAGQAKRSVPVAPRNGRSADGVSLAEAEVPESRRSPGAGGASGPADAGGAGDRGSASARGPREPAPGDPSLAPPETAEPTPGGRPEGGDSVTSRTSGERLAAARQSEVAATSALGASGAWVGVLEATFADAATWLRALGRQLAPALRSVDLGPDGADARVTEEDRHLDVRLDWSGDTVEPRCGCLARDGEWCVHALALALAAIERSRRKGSDGSGRLTLGGSRTGDSAEAATTHLMVGLEGGGELFLHLPPDEPDLGAWMRRARQVLSRDRGEPEGLFEPRKSGAMTTAEAWAWVLATEKGIDEGGGVRVPRERASRVFVALAEVPGARLTNAAPIRFSVEPATVHLEVSAESLPFPVKVMARTPGRAGEEEAKVNVSSTDSAGAISPVAVLPGPLAWAVSEGTAHPLHPHLADLCLDTGGSCSLGADDIGRLLFEPETLPPGLVVHAPGEHRRQPSVIPRSKLRVSGSDTGVTARLEFEYRGVGAPPFGGAEESRGWVAKVEPTAVHWSARHRVAEAAVVRVLRAVGIHMMREGSSMLSGDAAVDVVNFRLAELEGWIEVIDEGGLEPWIIPDSSLNIRVAVSSRDDASIQLVVRPRLAGASVPLGLLRDTFAEGRRFARIPGVGHAPIAGVSAILEALDEIEVVATTVDPATFRAPKSRIGLFPDSASGRIEMEWSEELVGLASGLQTAGDDPTGVADPVERRQEPESITEGHRALSTVLRPYQERGRRWLEFLAEHRLGGVLADDMGLGKTVQALALLQGLSNSRGRAPSLVVAPASVVLAWRDQTARLAPGLRLVLLSGRDKPEVLHLLAHNELDIVVCSFAGLRTHIEDLSSIQWRIFFVDEAQFVKNEATATAQCARRVRAEARFALTGTPIENHLGELRAIVDLVVPGFLGSAASFRRRFAEPIEAGSQAAAARLRRRLRPYLLRRVKGEVATDLPEKIEVDLRLAMPAGHQTAYRRIAERVRADLRGHLAERGLHRSGTHVLAALTRLRQAACHPILAAPEEPFALLDTAKSLALEEKLPPILAEGHRAILFSSFTSYLDRIEELLKRLQIESLRLDGTIAREDRARRLALFQSGEGPGVFLISLKAGGSGLDLTRADYVFHMDPWWNPAAMDQATDRAHRIGRTERVISYRLVTAGSIEERILELQDKKRKLVDRALGGTGEFGATLEELEDLIFDH